VQTAALGEAMLKKFDVKLRAVPLGNEMSRSQACRAGVTNFEMGAYDVKYALRGLEAYGAREWGPQPLRQVYLTKRKTASSAATQGNAGIEVPADLKGKKVAWIVGSSGQNATTEAILAFGGLTWDDVEKVEFASTTTAWEAMVDGKIATIGGFDSMSSYAYKLEAKPGGIKWLRLDPKDTEGWARLNAILPEAYPIMCTQGAGFSEDNPFPTMTFCYPAIACYESVDADLVYWQVKMIAEGFDLYKDLAPQMPFWDIDLCVSVAPYLPWHEGAIRYFKEIGKWTPEMEKVQNNLLKLSETVSAAWDAAVKEADEKSIPAKEWGAFWKTKTDALSILR
jgi:TRAP transporter TAXI family solute receptor